MPSVERVTRLVPSRERAYQISAVGRSVTILVLIRERSYHISAQCGEVLPDYCPVSRGVPD